jgi:hypothetical protein
MFLKFWTELNPRAMPKNKKASKVRSNPYSDKDHAKKGKGKTKTKSKKSDARGYSTGALSRASFLSRDNFVGSSRG